MRYEDAIKLKEENERLIGTIDSKGFVINEIIIVPQNEDARKQFFSAFLFNRNAEMSIMPFKNLELEVWAIDTKHLNKTNVLFYDKLD